MKLEWQVCSLELAKRLKELGAPQDSLFYWFGPVSIGLPRRVRAAPFVDYCANITLHPIIASAFTVAELGAMLPKALHADLYLEADTEADARAKTLIYLLERISCDRQARPR
jgi:hypothetical protein